MKPITKKTVGRFTLPLLLQLFFVVALFTSCNDQAKDKRQRDIDNFKSYVSAHKDSVDAYTSQKWEELNAEFEEKKAKLDKELDKMDEQMRTAYDNAVNDWNSFKDDYTRKTEENAKVAEMDKLRATLVIEGVRPDYTDLSSKDILKEYEHFVSTVKAHKDEYTKEQWTVINVNYKALNGRKREIDKDISASDNGKIIKLQLEYTAIKAVNRPFADA